MYTFKSQRYYLHTLAKKKIHIFMTNEQAMDPACGKASHNCINIC